ncbi:hypothetical protein [uncultured Phenylobacterium sp.]|uniref:hypothetical protein n=1 Tax=uncultured Phenylobacterium sp. TaxID=349273 RepID=UPI0025DE6F3A|nr:hypothetical protein [uncultured Phenylobacterium sp.]
MRAIALAGVLALGVAQTGAAADVCPKWGPLETVGALDGKLINEASGLEASVAHPGRLYHHNDSGDDLRFFVTDMAGGGAKVVNVAGPKPRDIEDMSLGPCGRATCIYLGDIGDNAAARADVTFTLVREKRAFAGEVKPLRAVRARYPDGAHNAEAFAVHPDGDLYVITKPADGRVTRRDPALVFRLSAAQLRAAGEVQVFEKVGEIDLPKIAPELGIVDWIPTAMDITADGRRVALLTYGAIYELAVDLSRGLPAAWTRGRNLQIVRFKRLPQQEAIAWLPDGSGLLLDTEVNNQPTAPLLRLRCEG